MNKERWQQIQAIFDHLTDKTPGHRKDYLDMVCEDDDDLRGQVLKLLSAHDEVTVAGWNPEIKLDNVLPGSDFAGYQLVEKLGEGGMGTVYRAKKCHSEVALKILPDYLANEERTIERFQQEAIVLQQLQHPSICQVLRIINEPGLPPAIAMEVCHGITLEEIISERSLDLFKIHQIFVQLLEALSIVHQQGIFHRDIKPSNILVASDFQIKLIDFGIAKFADAHLTATGTLLGTPKYMSPEQWRGEKVDHRTDLWALGILLYEMITGRTPFTGQTNNEIAFAILNNEPAALSGQAMNWQPLLFKLLAKPVERRFQSCEDVLAALPL